MSRLGHDRIRDSRPTAEALDRYPDRTYEDWLDIIRCILQNTRSATECARRMFPDVRIAEYDLSRDCWLVIQNDGTRFIMEPRQCP